MRLKPPSRSRKQYPASMQGDLSISGTANATITAWNTTDDTVYTATDYACNDWDHNPQRCCRSCDRCCKQSEYVDLVDANRHSIRHPAADRRYRLHRGVSITVPSGTQNGAFSVTITFTEAVSGFVQSELSLMSNTAGATITAWVASSDNRTYTATITPTTSGTVTLNVAANVATDAANNPKHRCNVTNREH